MRLCRAGTAALLLPVALTALIGLDGRAIMQRVITTARDNGLRRRRPTQRRTHTEAGRRW